MNLYAYLRVGPWGRIYIPAEFNKHIGLPNGPAFIEAKLCPDGYIELGPVFPGTEPPRAVSEMLPSLVVPDPAQGDTLDTGCFELAAEFAVERDAERGSLGDWSVDVEDGSVVIRSAWSKLTLAPSAARLLGRQLYVASRRAAARADTEGSEI
ncbi:hypothetical protein I3U51_21940 [Mycobacteroides abscessus subsp. abscessus]|uniref:hypothetical protein n=1 Tax=Mycobacteroides abscessus TaxID=36809 RepID=UPI0009A67BAC|nr:hypothetical protein [Mycobacteroides abscessus]MBN7443199.1 hypothetical protein [Mycobacteroides abscessus subsp. abscessus]SLH82303.1 Uncharacterised protein [Mycobacteroides abscessus subsp. abscessus]